ncbi:zinc finger protein 622-like protein [Euroglyphus maynei]|uniref:Zinc finger protein 622-like protein n=1 Tax=Euroglyphus maynei TaxID=6958 RepID=A0A1Y3B7B5_EURMA|nr:zinc finger protein 622-like protein [Euroglyphus maynei]
MNKLSCLTCQINLLSAIDQREHYKSEWHLYNLKRKLNQLKSITEDEFIQIKLKHTMNGDNNGQEGNSNESTKFYCDVCGKNFLNQKAFEQHNASNKHVKQMAIAARLLNRYNDQQKTKSNEDVEKQNEEEEFNESDWEEMDSDEEILETIPIDECLFCGNHSADIESNLTHMATIHSFFIPDLEYCIDVKGLLLYLGTKIAHGHCCLWCSDNGKTFSTIKSTQQHMIDVGHTKINFHNRTESLLEFEDFYDYSSSYPNDSKPQQQQADNDDDEVDLNVLDDDNYQLRLPSGAIIGHRSLMIYYKQKLRPQQQQLVPVDRSKNRELMNKIQHGYRMIGWNGMGNNLIGQQFVRDIQYMNRLKHKMQLRLGQKSNQTKQTNFRCQMGFK